VEFQLTDNTNDQYVKKLESNLSSGTYFADIIGAEAGYVNRIKDMPNAIEDISKAPYNSTEDLKALVAYAVEIGKDSAGVQRFIPTQATPCGISYKRELAKKYLGTDDPAKVAEMMKLENLEATAKKVKEASAGKAKLFPGPGPLVELYLGSRASAWVKDNTFVYDPKMDECLDMLKKIRDLDQDAKLDDWTDAWKASFKDAKTISYLCASWGVPWMVGSNINEADKEAGKWAVCDSPVKVSWGGSWLGIPTTAKNKETAYKALKSLLLDAESVEKRVTAGAVPDFTSNMAVNEKLAKDDKQISKMLNQNFFQVFLSNAEGINANLMSKYDDAIKKEYNNQAKLFLQGDKTKEQVKADLITAMKESLKGDGVKFE
jgi:hypothetical protein